MHILFLILRVYLNRLQVGGARQAPLSFSLLWGFATSLDKGRIEAHIRHVIQLNPYQDTDPTASQLAEDADDTLFENILANPKHVLRHLLPSRTQHSYKLRPRRHDCFLTVKSDARNFITRQLSKDMY